MDRLPHPYHALSHQHLQPSTQSLPPPPQQHHGASSLHSPSLVCVGGMLRVAHLPDLAITTPAPSPTKPYSETNVTPFKQLASPFTASAPFTAPTTPTYSTTPHSTTTTTVPSTPYSTLPTHSAPQAFYSLVSPTPNTTCLPTLNSTTNNIIPETHDLQPQPQAHLLTQKQVRELRRLCRKTANRAEFEGRLIQVRQVASIAAMATSTIHLFDPSNPASGYPLRIWVEKHRAEGADWRDERPLSTHAITELRRWDQLLKAWARVRFENPTADARCNTRTERMENSENVLKPVRLEFEKITLASSASPTTPANTQKPRNVYSTDFLRMASPVTPAESSLHHLANTSNAATPAYYNNVNAGSSSYAGSVVQQDGETQSAWSKPPLTGLSRMVDSRKPMTEVSVNRVGDTIKVTVPPANNSGILKSGHDNNSRFVGMKDQENTIPADLRRGTWIHASTTAKSWRNALMQTPESHDEGVQLGSAAKTLFPGHDGRITAAGGIGSRCSPMDWGKFRRGAGAGDEGTGGEVWQNEKNM